MGRRRVEIEVVLFDVLAVVGFAVRQSEETLLEDRVPAVPQGEGETDPLLVVGEARQSVFPPAIGARARMIVSEEVPGVAVVAVVFANGAPLALAQIRTPLLPGNLLLARRDETFRFRGRVLGLLGLRVHRAAPCRLR